MLSCHGLGHVTDTSKNIKATFKCCHAMASALSQHTDSSKNIKATVKPFYAWAVSQHTDTSKNTKATLECCHAMAWTVSLTPVRTSRLHSNVVMPWLGLCHNTLTSKHQGHIRMLSCHGLDCVTDTSKNIKATFKCCHAMAWVVSQHTDIKTSMLH